MWASDRRPPSVDEDSAESLKRFSFEVCGLECPPETPGLFGQSAALIGLPAAVGYLGLPQQQGAIVDAAGVILQVSTRSLQPARSSGRTGSQAVILVEPDRAHAGSAVLAQRFEYCVCLLASLDALLDPP